MANFQVKDATGTSIYFKSTGTGTNGDPFIPGYTFTGTTAGDVAHDVSDSGNPVKIGGKARTSNPTAVATLDRVDGMFDTIGRLVTSPYALSENSVRGVLSTDLTTTTRTQVIAAQGAGIRIYVTNLVLFNSHASTATRVDIESGTALVYTVYLPASNQVQLTLPMPLRLNANEALNVTCGTAATVRVSASGFTGP